VSSDDEPEGAAVAVHSEDAYEKVGGWTPVHIGYFTTPKGTRRSCGHRHGSEQAADRCVRALARHVWRDASRA
jgi:hypothetical protein